MEFKKCIRCGNFYLSEADVCPNCTTKDTLEFEKFKKYISENGINNNLDILAQETGISEKNLNRFLDYAGYNNSPNKNNINL